MRELTSREKRTLRFASVAMVVYLGLFAGLRGWKTFSKHRSDYEQLRREAQSLQREIQPYEAKALLVQKLMENARLDPARLNRSTLVAEASAAIQKAATSSGLQVGPVREENARASNKELATIKLEGSGPVPAVTALFHRLESLGYPLIIDSVQIGSDTGRGASMMGSTGPTGLTGPMGAMSPMGLMGAMGPPGMIKLSLTIVILDFQQWKNEEVPNA